MKKYVCMMKGCDFITEDLEEAKSHGEMGADHMGVEVAMEEESGEVSCMPTAGMETGGTMEEEEEEEGKM